MKVEELITELQRFQGGIRVVVDGYEYGYSDITSSHIATKHLVLNQHGADWAGEHEVVSDEKDYDESALVISRYEQ